jgi:hypothetical protein
MGKDNYDVGYGKPPKASRFKPGQSGNPRGRPRGQPNLLTDLLKELAEQIRISESGREKTVSKQRAMVKALVAKSLKGEARAASILIGLLTKLVESQASEAAADIPAATAKEDQAIIEAFLRRSAAAASQAEGQQRGEDGNDL